MLNAEQTCKADSATCKACSPPLQRPYCPSSWKYVHGTALEVIAEAQRCFPSILCVQVNLICSTMPITSSCFALAFRAYGLLAQARWVEISARFNFDQVLAHLFALVSILWKPDAIASQSARIRGSLCLLEHAASLLLTAFQVVVMSRAAFQCLIFDRLWGSTTC